MTKACAIISTYNEGDIIKETVVKLIQHGIEVFIIDNNSTDTTVNEIASLVGKGVIDISSVIFRDNNQAEVYNWTSLLREKELVAQRLDHDWFIHADADEIRLPPWENYSLLDGISRVDTEGYNLINFKLLNFRPVRDVPVDSSSYEDSMSHYSEAEVVNLKQVKCWKRSEVLDIASSGGHSIGVSNPKPYPLRFILKHYPIRTRAQAIEKVVHGRKARFMPQERAKGWHSQYDEFQVEEHIKTEWNLNELSLFDYKKEISQLQEEANDVLIAVFGSFLRSNPYMSDTDFLGQCSTLLTERGYDRDLSDSFVNSFWNIARDIYNGQSVNIEIDANSEFFYRYFLDLLARKYFLNGDPRMYLERALFKVDKP